MNTKMIKKFKVGDRVVATQNKSCEITDDEEKIKRVRIKKGMTGTIICTTGGLFGVEFDARINGHSCDGTGTNGFCYYCPSDMIERYGARKRTNTVKLKVGDRVKCLRPTDSKKETVGKHGTVIDVRGNNISVEFDDYIYGHTCCGRGKDGYCWNCERDTLEKIQTVKELKEPTKMKFKVGDRVVATEDAGLFGAKIKKGMTGTVIGAHRSLVDVEFDDYINGHSCLKKGKDGHCWSCTLDMVDKILKDSKETQLDKIVLKKGDIITLSSGTVIIVPKDNVSVKGLDICSRIEKIERPTGYKAIYEAPKDILDKEEKEYLTAVLKPFRKKDIFIEKIYDYGIDKECISIRIHTSEYNQYMGFPYFKKGTMYKGMEVNKEYSLKELGL